MRRYGGSSVRHVADFSFHFRSVHHDDGIPRAAIEEAAVGTLAEALLAPDALEGVNLDAAERRIVLVRQPEDAVFHWTVLEASRRSRAARAALRNDGQFLRLLLARGGDTLGARLLLQLVGHHSWGFDNLRIGRHRVGFYLEYQALQPRFSPPVCPSLSLPAATLYRSESHSAVQRSFARFCQRGLQCVGDPVHPGSLKCSQSLSTNIFYPRSSPDLPCAFSSSGISPFIPATLPTTKSLPAIGCTTVSTASTPTGSFFPRIRARPAIPHSSQAFIFWPAQAAWQSCSRKLFSILPRVSWPQASPLVWPRALPTRPAAVLQPLRYGSLLCVPSLRTTPRCRKRKCWQHFSPRWRF